MRILGTAISATLVLSPVFATPEMGDSLLVGRAVDTIVIGDPFGAIVACKFTEELIVLMNVVEAVSDTGETETVEVCSISVTVIEVAESEPSSS